VAKVGGAAAAEDFGTVHAVGAVVFVDDAVFADGFVEAGPAAFAGEFGVGLEQYVAADGAVVGAFGGRVPVGAGEGALRVGLAGYAVEGRGKDLFPLRVGHLQTCGIGGGVVRILFVATVGFGVLREGGEREYTGGGGED